MSTNKSKNDADKSKLHPQIEKMRDENKILHKKCLSEFGQVLKDIMSETGATHEEVSEGIDLSRQTVFDLINGKSFINIDKFKLITLWEVLSNSDIYNERSRKSKLQQNYVDSRERLRADGPDRLLSIFGFAKETIDLPINSVKKAYQIISRLSSPVVSENLIWKIEDSVAEQIRASKNNNPTIFDLSESKALDSEIEKMIVLLNDQIGIDAIDRQTNQERFENAIKRYVRIGKSIFTDFEIIELFYSIKQKTIERKGLDEEFIVHVLSCEIKSLDFCQRVLDEIIGKDKKNTEEEIISRINLCGKEAKQKHGIEPVQEVEEEIGYSTIKEAQIDCIYFDSKKNRVDPSKKKFSWVYRSNDTNVRNILNAITRGLGIEASLEELKINSLSSNSDSLIKVSCLVKINNNKQELYRGVWVDMDILTCIAQSFICACGQWIKKQNIGNLIQEMYYNMHLIYRHIGEARDALYYYKTERNFERNNIDTSDTSNPNSLRNFERNNIDASDTSNPNLLESIIKNLKKSSKNMKKIMSENEKIKSNFPYLVEFIDFAIQYSDFLDIRCSQINGNSKNAKDLIASFESEYLQDNSPYITMDFIKLMHKTEKMLNNIFQGNWQMVIDRDWDREEVLNDNDNIINKYISDAKPKHKNWIVHTTSFNYALSEYYGNWSRLDFYFCKRGEKKEFEKSINGFLRAAYFSLQNDNAIRYSYWLCHAARSYARLGKISEADAALEIAEDVIDKVFKKTDDVVYKTSIKSICYLVKFENNLFKFEFEQTITAAEILFSKESIDNIVTAIIGFYIIGFERLMFDGIYELSQLIVTLNSFSGSAEEKSKILVRLKDSMTDRINEMSARKEDEQQLEKLLLVEKIEEASKKISEILEISKLYEDQVKTRWADWFNPALRIGRLTEHPICGLIDSNEFLSPFL
jgi:hypothetical protein